MDQKAFLVGSIAAISSMFFLSLAVHTGEASFVLGWLQAKNENYERSALFFRRAGKDSFSGSSLKDRANVAVGASLVASGKYLDATNVLMKGNDHSEGDEKLNLDALRLYAFGIARVHTAMQNDSESRRIQLESALEAFSGSYRLSGDNDAAHNYEVVKRLFEEEKKKEEGKRKEEEQEEQKKDKEAQQDKEQEEKPQQDKEEQKEDEPQSEKETAQPPASPVPNQGNWTNGGDPQTLRSDPGGNKGANVTVPLSPAERQELENALKGLAELQENRGKYVRPDGSKESDGNIPNHLRELFFGDSFLDSFFPDSEADSNGKSW
jgi:hypothetical protein